ncbi:Transposase DDE domain protein [Variovorax sp. SRS16]|nr:Transposase DDE domain protein [Variovorax sp. SRS16]
MHQTKKGNAWHFGMKAHIGVDAQSGLVHSVVATAANVNDVTQAGALLHGEETVAFGDAGYRGVDKRAEAQGPKWHVAMQPGKRRQLDPARKWARLLEKAEQLKASIRTKVEHPFHVIKNLFRHRKTRYKGLAKNEAQLFSLFGLANLITAKRSLLAAHTRGATWSRKVTSTEAPSALHSGCADRTTPASRCHRVAFESIRAVVLIEQRISSACCQQRDRQSARCRSPDSSHHSV